LVLGLVEARDFEEASFAVIENGGEDAWGVELRKATPVDRTVHAHQRDRVQGADDAAGPDWLICPFAFKKAGLQLLDPPRRRGRARSLARRGRAPSLS